MLAGVSTDYYAKMERGNLAGVSPEILDAVARALQLDEAETEHLHDLARAAGPAPWPAAAPAQPSDRPAVAATAPRRHHRRPRVGDEPRGRTPSPPTRSAGRCSRRCSTTRPAAATTPGSPSSARPPRIFYPDWEQGADSIVASMRSAAGRNPHDKPLTDLIGELVTRSDEFRLPLVRARRPLPPQRHQTHPPP